MTTRHEARDEPRWTLLVLWLLYTPVIVWHRICRALGRRP